MYERNFSIWLSGFAMAVGIERFSENKKLIAAVFILLSVFMLYLLHRKKNNK